MHKHGGSVLRLDWTLKGVMVGDSGDKRADEVVYVMRVTWRLMINTSAFRH